MPPFYDRNFAGSSARSSDALILERAPANLICPRSQLRLILASLTSAFQVSHLEVDQRRQT
jgi:hypothetical protein